MAKKNGSSCPNCRRLEPQLKTLQRQIDALHAELFQVKEQLAAARKNSTTSSKPPSSDIVKPPREDLPPDGGPRTIGGQPGHAKHERLPFPPEDVEVFEHYIEVCPDCGHGLQPSGFAPTVIQQVDVRVVPLHIEEHRQHEAYCPCCDKVFRGALPPEVEQGGLVGPHLTAFIAYLKGVCHASYSTIRKFLRDVVRVSISRGQLAKVIAKVSQALAGPYEELLRLLPTEDTLNVDETGHKNNKERFWTWCFRAELYTLFKVSPSRGADVLIEVLGQEFEGVLGCDYFSAYRRYMREFGAVVQFCLAHFIRDVKYLTTLPHREDREYGERLREALRQLFGVIHQQGRLSKAAFQCRLSEARDEVLRQGLHLAPPTKAAGRLAARLQKHGTAYFQFITTPGVHPTNNAAEQAIRFVVIDRLITQGTRSETGQRWSERIWTAIATCQRQGRSVFEFLRVAVQHCFRDEASPSLLNFQAGS